MSKRIKAKYKKSRRLGVSLWGRGKDAFNKKNYAPGIHGPLGLRKRQQSDYGVQLRAKQQLKCYYGNVTEKQFRKTFQQAVRMKGDTGENLVGLLERRLDAILYRAKFAPTVFSSRQLISHKHVKVNGQTVNIPSYRVSVGDVIEVKEKSRTIPMVLQAVGEGDRSTPDYLEIDAKAFTAKYLAVPKLADVPYPVVMEPNLVVEFYSR